MFIVHFQLLVSQLINHMIFRVLLLVTHSLYMSAAAARITCVKGLS